MNEILFEIMHESIPLDNKEINLKQWNISLEKTLNSYLIQNYKIQTYLTNTRLLTVISNVPQFVQQEDEKIRGPREKTDQSIIDKFLTKHNKTKEDLYINNGFIYINKTYEKKNIIDIIPNIFLETMSKMKWNKSMFWGEKNSWIRPIRRTICLYNETPLLFHEFEISTSSNFLYDFINKKEFIAYDFKSYKEKLEEESIYLDDNTKLQKLNEIITNIPLNIKEEEMKSVINKIENMHVYHTKIQDEFNLPIEIKRDILKEQNYIGKFKDNKLTDIIILSEQKMENVNLLIKQSIQTLFSKFDDMMFFWKSDLQNDIQYYLKKLENTILYNNLGSLKQKQDRMFNIAKSFQNDTNLLRSIELFQIGICMSTVDEMPQFQSLMSCFFAINNNETTEVSNILKSQYTGKNHNINSIYLKFLNNLDTLIAFVGNNIIPTGSADPLAIRRKCIHVIQDIFQLHDLGLNVNIQDHIDLFENEFKKQNINLNLSKLNEFIQKRFEYILKLECLEKAYMVFNEKNMFLAKEKLKSIKSFDQDKLNIITSIYHRLSGLNYSNIEEKSDEITDEMKILLNFLKTDSNLNDFFLISCQIEEIFKNTLVDKNLHLKYLLKQIYDRFSSYANFGKEK